MLKVISYISSILIVVAFLFFCYIIFLKFSLVDQSSEELSRVDLDPVVDAPEGQMPERQKQDFSLQGEKKVPGLTDKNLSLDEFSLADEVAKQKLFAEQVSNEDWGLDKLDSKEKKPLIYYLVLTEDKLPNDLSPFWDELNSIGLSDKIKVVQTPNKKLLVSYLPNRDLALRVQDKIYRNTGYMLKIQKREISE
jgi:hypothetical protein